MRLIKFKKYSCLWFCERYLKVAKKALELWLRYQLSLSTKAWNEKSLYICLKDFLNIKGILNIKTIYKFTCNIGEIVS